MTGRVRIGIGGRFMQEYAIIHFFHALLKLTQSI